MTVRNPLSADLKLIIKLTNTMLDAGFHTQTDTAIRRRLRPMVQPYLNPKARGRLFKMLHLVALNCVEEDPPTDMEQRDRINAHLWHLQLGGCMPDAVYAELERQRRALLGAA